MFRKLSNSWELVKASLQVLKADSELILFPIISSVAMTSFTVAAALPLYLFIFQGGYLENEQTRDVILYGTIFVIGFFEYAIVTYFKAALVGAALIRLDGGDPTVKDGFRIATSRFSTILGFALLGATVGVILRVLRDKAEFLGNILAAIGNTAWSLATFLVVPVMVSRQMGPLESVKESTRLLKKTWGEQIVGGAGIGLVFFLVALGFTFLGVAPMFYLASTFQSGNAAIAVIIFAILGYVVIGLLSATLNAIYAAALYRFATDGKVEMFEPRLLQDAFRQK